jgi:hypothetical protein
MVRAVKILAGRRLVAAVALSLGAIGAVAWLAATLAPPAGATSDAATAAQASPPPTCVVHSLPSFVAQGEGALSATVADVIEVECNPTVYGTGSTIKITASQLFTRCRERLTWIVPNPYSATPGRGVTLTLDADGNATVAVLGGPECSAGESLITAHMEETPFESFTTSFTVLPPSTTTPGVFALPATQVEDASSSGVATIVQAEFSDGSEKRVHIASEELFARCRQPPHLHWILMDGSEPEERGSEVNGVELDNDGNAFVIAVGDSSCAPGSSLIEADLESKPFTTYTTNFAIEPPQPTGEPDFTIEKQQQIRGSGGGFTTAPLTGAIGQTVEYEIKVANTADVAETLSGFTDAHCDPGTIAGGPGASPLSPGQSTTYTCSHLLSTVGAYTNEATVTASSVGGTPLTQTSNQVVVEVAAAPGFTIEKRQEVAGSGSGFTTSPVSATVGQTVDYQIVVTNTGNVALTFSSFTDPRCDEGTIAGGPGKVPVAPGSSTTFTCSHVLTAAGTYINEASVTGTPPGGTAITHPSNAVEATVSAEAGPVTPVTPGITPGVVNSTAQPPAGTGVRGEICRSPVLHNASGPRRGTFTVKVNAAGIKRITFYLDGRKLKTLKQSQAKKGKFAVNINPRKLRPGAHRVSIKTVMSNPRCATVARSGVFVRPAAQQVLPRFTA